MSFLDIAENPDYEIVAVALSKDDVVLMLNVKEPKLINALEVAIALLQTELQNQRSLIRDNTAPAKES